jgi:hypothetical protein
MSADSQRNVVTPQSPLLTILVTNWNGRAVLRDCLRSIYEKTAGLSFEVIVVDDASTDDSVQMVTKDFPQVELVAGKTNVGYVRANNLGVTRAKGKYVLLLNSDTYLLDNALKTLVDFMETNPSAGVCGCWLKNINSSSQVSFGSYPSFLQAIVGATFLPELFPAWRLPNRGVKPVVQTMEPQEVDYITGADLLTRKSLIDQMGLFDERFTAYCEETDYCYRVKHTARQSVTFVPSAVIIHLEGASYNKIGRRKTRIYYRSTNLFLEKHHGVLYALATRLVYGWTHFVKLIVRSAMVAFVPAVKKPEMKNRVSDSWYAFVYSLFPPTESAKG